MGSALDTSVAVATAVGGPIAGTVVAGTKLAVKGIDEVSGAKAAREEAKAAGQRQMQALDKLQTDAQFQQENSRKIASETKAQRDSRARAGIAKSGKGRQGTILTGPEGAPVPLIGMNYSGKTLLGG